MKYVLVENGQVTKTRLPKTGVLKDGSTVSNYNLLPHDVLIAEGWLPLIDEPPETDDKHRAVITGYEIYGDRVEAIYSIEEIIPPAISEEELQDKARLKAQQLAIKPIIAEETLTIDEILEVAPLFPAYEAGKVYKVGDIFTYKRSLFEVVQEHTSQEGWKPDVEASLYKNHTPKGEIEDWRQPLGAHDAYQIGDKVIYNEQTWVCVKGDASGNNVWAPDVYGWELESSSSGGDPEEYPAWVQPTGAHDVYHLNDIVTYNEQLWISTVDNNSWAPGVYGWEIYTA